MKLLLDTHLLLWTAGQSPRLSTSARMLIQDPTHTPVFSVVSLWELAIKRGLARDDLVVNPRDLREECLDNGYEELPITSSHAFAVEALPPLHRDPFDRLLVAQASVEGFLLLTADTQLAAYPGPVRLV